MERRYLLIVAAAMALFLGTIGGARTSSVLVALSLVAGAALLWPRDLSGARDARTDAAGDSTTPVPTSAEIDWRVVLDGLPDPAVLLDGHTHVLAANKIAVERLDVRQGLALAHSLRMPDLLSAVDEALRGGHPQKFEVQTTAPLERTLAVMVTPLQGTDSIPAVPSLLVVLHDRTEEQQLAQMRANFVSNASHELRTPLASLKGFIETLRGAAKDDAAARERFLGIMQEQADRMTRLIEDLLSLSRIEMRQHLPPQDAVSLSEVVDATVRALRQLAEKEDRQISVSITADDPIVRGDRDELAQVAHNLAQNAIKYGHRGGHVLIKVRPEGQRIALEVTDDGIGIAPEHLPRLTERFYRVSAKASRERGGTGLGLAIVKHIVNRHGGDLRISSQIGQGSTFTVILDRASLHDEMKI